MSLIELGLDLDLNPFIGKLATAEGALKRIQVQAKTGVTVAARLDTSSIWPSLEAVKKTLAKEKVTLKVATEFYRVGSGNSISAKSLKEGVLKTVQQTVNGSDEYKIKIGTTFKFDENTTKQIKATIKQLDASIERFNAAKAAAEAATRPSNVDSARQRLTDLTRTEAKGGLNPAELRRLQNEASKVGIKTSATGATELRKELREEFLKAGEDAIKGLAKGLVENPTSVLRAGSKMVDTLIKGFKDDLGIRSPSKKTADEIGKPMAEGIGKGFIDSMVGLERRMAASLRQALGNAIQQGWSRDQATRSALMAFGKDAGATVATSLSKALKQGLASSVAPALKGGLLGGAGGLATGGLIGAATAASGAVKQAAMPAITAFGSAGMTERLGMLGKGSASLVSGQASEAFNQFIQSSLDSVMSAALSSGGQGALLGAAGVAGVAGLAGLAKGASGSLVSQAVESIKNRILGTAAQQAQAQAALPGSTAGAVAAPIENAGNVMGLLQNAITKAAKNIAEFAKNIKPGEINQKALNFAWWLDQAAGEFAAIKRDTQVLSGKIKQAWSTIGGASTQLLPPQPVPGTGLIREQNLQLGAVTGRTSIDFRRPGAYGKTGGLIGPEEAANFDPNFLGAWLDQERKGLQTVRQAFSGNESEWRIVDEVNGVWRRIKTDSELAAERMAQIRAAITGSQSFTSIINSRNTYGQPGQAVRSQFTSYTGNIGSFNPFDPAFYRPTRPPQAPPTPGDSNFIPTGPNSFGSDGRGGGGGGNRFGTPNPGGALALRNVPVEFFASFRDAERLLAIVEQRLSAVAKAFDVVGVKSQIQVDQGLRSLAVSLRAIEIGFQRGEVSAEDLRAAWYSADREFVGLSNKSAEVQNLARAFENLGIQSRDAIEAIQDQRNIDLAYINNTLGQYHPEAIKAQNARDIQQMQRANDFVRTAQGAAGFGGFRGREIGNEILNQAQQRSVLANAVREMREYQQTLTRTETNTRTYERVQNALNAEIRDAERAWRVLNGEASDGERIAVVARNAWGTILDDFQNLVPQLLVFAVAYNLILQRVMTTPGVVIQAAAAFDRLETSISSYLSATRGIGDSTAVLGSLKQVALDLGIGFEKAASSYLRFAAATQGTPLQGQEVDIARTLATAGRNQGLSGEQIDRASVALTQILSKGQVQSEELRGQLAEQLPGALQVASRAFGVTTKELYRMVEAGQIAGDEFVAKFIAQLKAEGADVNQLAGSFSNVSEQFGSSMQMFAAAAGEPFLQPLTLALRGLNAAVSALIPLGAPLAAMFIAIGSTVAKSALQIRGTWGQAVTEALATAMEGDSGILGPDGQPVRSGRGRQFRAGLQQARQGVTGLGAALTGQGAGDGALKSMATSAKDLGSGLKSAAIASLDLSSGLKGALASALKLYLAIEGISFAIKLFTGQLGKLNSEQQKSSQILAGKSGGEEQLNFLQKALAAANKLFNPFKRIEELGDDFTRARSRQMLRDGQETKRRIDENRAQIKKASDEWVAIDKQLYEKRGKLRDNNTAEQDKALKDEIKALEGRRANVVKSLPKGIAPNDVQAQIALRKSAIQAAEERKKKLESTNFLFFENGRIEGEKKLIEALKESNAELEKQLKLYGALGQIPTLTGLQAQLKRTEDYLGTLDVNSPEYTRTQGVAAGRRKLIETTQKLPQELAAETQALELEKITAELKVQENIYKVRLSLIESEKRQLESTLELERTRSRLSETIAQRRVSIANEVNAPEEALAGEVELRRVREEGQRRELEMQGRITNKERERITIQATLEKQQVRLQAASLQVQNKQLDIQAFYLRLAIETGRREKTISAQRANELQQQLNTITAVVTANQNLIDQSDLLNQSIDQRANVDLGILDTKQKQLRIEEEILREAGYTQEMIDKIKAATQDIENKEAAQLATVKKQTDEYDRQRNLIDEIGNTLRITAESERERLRLAEDSASQQLQLVDRLLEAYQNPGQGGFFERIAESARIARQSEGEAMALANRRMELMRRMQDQQIKQKQLDLNLKEQELKLEEQIYKLKLAQAKAENDRAKITARKNLEQIRVTLQAIGGNLTSSGKKALADVESMIGQLSGYNADLGQGGSTGNSLTVQLKEAMNDAANTLRNDRSFAEQERLIVDGYNQRVALNRQQQQSLAEEIRLRKELFSLDLSKWFTQFLDKTTQLGRTLSEAAAGISEFRSSVSKAFSDAIFSGGDAAAAISDAGKSFGSKVMGSLFDEYIFKPMEQNLFAGLAKILNFKTPETEQQTTAANTQSTDLNTTAIDANTDALKGLTQGLDRLEQDRATVQQNGPKTSTAEPVYRQPENPGTVGGLAADTSLQSSSLRSGTPIRGAMANRLRDRDGEATGWDIVVPGGVGGRVSNPFGSMKITGTGFHGRGSGRSGRGYGNWVSGEVEVAGKIFDILLGHFQKIDVKRGDVLGPGATIGLQGETGRTFGTHVTTHVNPLNGASVNDAWNVLEKLTRAWESGTIVPSSGGSRPALGPQSSSVIGDQFSRLISMKSGLSAIASAGAVPVVVQNNRSLLAQHTQYWDGKAYPIDKNTPLPVESQGSPLTPEPAPLPTSVAAPLPSQPSTYKPKPLPVDPFIEPAAQPAATQLLPTTGSSVYETEMLKLSNSILTFTSTINLSDEQFASLWQSADQMKTGFESTAQLVQKTPSKFESLNNTIGGVVSLLGSVAMGVAGFQQMKKGGTYNTLMGLAGIFGSLGSVTGFFAKGGFGSMFRASGGPVRARTPYIVGEEGPELFMPNQNGSVLSNPDTMDLFSSTRQNLKAQQATFANRPAPVRSMEPLQPIDVRYEAQVINNVEYVTADQHRKGMQEAARRGQMLAYQGMQHSVKVRRRLGM